MSIRKIELAPQFFSMDGVVIDTEGRVHLGRDRGRSLKRLHRPNRFRVWLHELKGESGPQYHYGVGPVYLNEGLMKPRRGFTPVAGEEKLGGQGKIETLDSVPLSRPSIPGCLLTTS